MYDPELLRQICKEIATEKNSGRLQDLLSLLRAVIEDDQEELRAQLLHLADRYALLNERLKQ